MSDDCVCHRRQAEQEPPKPSLLACADEHGRQLDVGGGKHVAMCEA